MSAQGTDQFAAPEASASPQPILFIRIFPIRVQTGYQRLLQNIPQYVRTGLIARPADVLRNLVVRNRTWRTRLIADG
jgi:hypothetical protein